MSTELLLVLLLGGCLAWILWVLAGFPLLVRFLASRRPRRTPPVGAALPSVSFLVPCRNEEAFVLAKAENLRTLGSRLSKWEGLMIDDASTDGTAHALASIEGSGISVLCTGRRTGKIGVLRMAARSARGEILVFTDCGCRLDPEGLAPLLAWFADPKVGLVTGSYRPEPVHSDARVRGEQDYWDSEMRLRQDETTLGSVTHATGALLAVRKEVFLKVDWPEDTINDDIHLPLRVLEMGLDVVCEPRAQAREPVETDVPGEFRRRIRIAAGNFQALREVPALARAGRWLPLLQLFSHKLLRNALGLPLLGALLSLLGLSVLHPHPLLVVPLLGAGAAVGLSLYAVLTPHSTAVLRRPAAAGYALLALAASLLGLVRWLRGWRPTRWERTDHLAGVSHG